MARHERARERICKRAALVSPTHARAITLASRVLYTDCV